MRLSVVIVNYNVKHFLEQCLRSVFKAVGIVETEVIVVDNNSVDGSIQMVEENFPEVQLIINEENAGFSKANNQAIRISKGEYILLLNPDTVVPENAFTKLLEFMDAKPQAGACGVRMIDGKGSFLPESKRGLPTPEVALYKMIGLNRLFPKSEKFGKYHLGYLNEYENHDVDVLSGAFMLLRKSALEKTGLLDETFFMYGEDIDLSYRMSLAGYKNYYYSGISIIHYKGESTKKRTANYVKIFYKAMIIFAQKHYKGRYRKWFTGFINLAIYARAALAMIANNFRMYWILFFEAALIFSSLYFLKEYWEEHIKYIDHYPPEMIYIHLPYYTFSWLLALILSGAYTERYNFSKLIRGMLIGTGIIFMILGILPDRLHFSRGIILFGTLLVSAMLLFWRTLLHIVQYKTLDFSLRDSSRTVLIGNADKWGWLNQTLQNSAKEYQNIGFASEEASDHPNYLGPPSQLPEIVNIFQINELIFDSESISSEKIMHWMNSIGPQVSYFIIPSKTEYLIGSHSKNASGLFIGQQIDLNLSRDSYMQQKRAFDFFTSILILILSPFLIWFKPRNYFSNCLNVFRGKKTWLGYASDAKHLPTLAKGVFTTVYAHPKTSILHREQLDQMYARSYSLSTDINALMRYLFVRAKN